MDERIMYKRSRVLREYVASFHLSTMFIGLVFCSIGAYLINSNTSRTVSILFLIVGVLITTAAFIGCFGAHIENTGFLNTYSSITAIALILEFVTLGLLYSHKSELDYYASSIWTFFGDNDARFLLDLERSFKCCGYGWTGDRAVPSTCSVMLGVEVGCRESIVTHIQVYRHWITSFIIALFIIQFIALLVTIILSFIMDRETREEETYMTLLSSQNNLHHHPSWLNGYQSNSDSFIINRHRSSQRSIPKYGSTPSN